MQQEVTFNGFCDAFRACGRKDQFSYNGLRALYDYLEELDEAYVLDVGALCCDYVEYESATEAFEDYNSDELTGEDEADREETALDYFRNRTILIELDGGIIIGRF
jgi:hypothetical protein